MISDLSPRIRLNLAEGSRKKMLFPARTMISCLFSVARNNQYLRKTKQLVNINCNGPQKNMYEHCRTRRSDQQKYTYKAETNLILNVFGHSFIHTGVYI